MTPKAKDWIRRALRQASLKWPPRNIAQGLARCDDLVYTIQKEKDRSWRKVRCASCDGVFRFSEVEMDHIEPVVSIYGYVDLQVECERLFVPVDAWAVLCLGCHEIKTTFEDLARADYANEQKEKNEKTNSCANHVNATPDDSFC